MPRPRRVTTHARIDKKRIFNLQSDYRRLSSYHTTLSNKLDALISQFGRYPVPLYYETYNKLTRKLQTVNKALADIRERLQ